MKMSQENRSKLELRRAGVVELLRTLAAVIHDLSVEEFAAMLSRMEKPLTALSAMAERRGRRARGRRRARPRVRRRQAIQ